MKFEQSRCRLAKILVKCVKTAFCVHRGRNLEEEFSERSVFCNIFGLRRENLDFYCEISQEFQNYILHVQRNTYRATFPKKNFHFFRISDKVFVTMSKFFLQVCQDCNNFSVRTNWAQNLYQNRKTHFFSRFWVNSLFLLLPRKFARIFKIATFVALEDHQEKQFSKFCTMFKPSSNSEPKSNTFSRKIFFGVVTTAFRASRRIFWGKFFLR